MRFRFPPQVAGLLLLALLFLAANRPAYKGYFNDDDLDNMSWTMAADGGTFLEGFLTPKYYPWNFRPTGHLLYFALVHTVRLEFPWYLAVVQLLHLVNMVLLYALARRLGAERIPALAACLFFAFHYATFDAFWKPMYVFDTACGTFCLLTLLAYAWDRPWLGVLAFWLAIRSKEVAIMLPAVLALYEFALRERRVARLVPYFAISGWFGIQAMIFNRSRDDDYSLRFNLSALAACARYYLGPVLVAVIAAVGVFCRGRRALVTLGGFALLVAPLLFLPGRLYLVYLYVPLLLLSLGVAFVLGRVQPRWIAAGALAWAFFTYRDLIRYRSVTLEQAGRNRAYVAELARFAAETPLGDHVLIDGLPRGMNLWGAAGALRVLSGNWKLEAGRVESAEDRVRLRDLAAPVLSWKEPERVLQVSRPGPDTGRLPFLDFTHPGVIWQLGKGWYGLEGLFRWCTPVAHVTLERPAGRVKFAVRVQPGPAHLAAHEEIRLEPRLGTVRLGVKSTRKVGPGWMVWDVPDGPPGRVEAELWVSPEYRLSTDPRGLGVPVMAIGFTREDPQ